MASKRRIRWDRVSVAAIILIILIFLLGSCMQKCSDSDAEEPTTAQQDSVPTDEQTAPSAETPASDTTTTTQNGADSTLANVPVIITDENKNVGDLGVTTTTTAPAGEDSAEPAYVLPAGYEEIPIEPSAMYKGTLVLVDQSNPSRLTAEDLDLEQVYYAKDKPDTYEISYPGHTSLNSAALAKFNRLMKAYYSATNNTEIMFNYGYLEAGKEKSNPESSTGLDVQIHLKKENGGYDFVSNVTPYSWLFDHMASYGYTLRYPTDKAEITGERGGYTALRYVGVPHAAYMAENNLCLEEYLDMLRGSHNFYSGTVLNYSTSELNYLIYYVPANADNDFKIPVPKAGSYEISGNNTDGFIVTAIVS